MYEKLSGKKPEPNEFIESQKYNLNLKLISLEKSINRFSNNIENIYKFQDSQNNFFVCYTSLDLPIEENKNYEVFFTYKKFGIYKGNKCHFIKNLKIK